MKIALEQDFYGDYVSSNKAVVVTRYEDNSGVIVQTELDDYHLKAASSTTFKGTCGKYNVEVSLNRHSCLTFV